MSNSKPTQARASSPNRTTSPGGPKRKSFRQMDDTAPTWDGVPAELVSALVCMCTTQGASPTFGYTRNGRALTLAVWWKGERDVQYLASSDEVREYFLFLAVEWFDLSDEELSYYRIGAPTGL